MVSVRIFKIPTTDFLSLWKFGNDIPCSWVATDLLAFDINTTPWCCSKGTDSVGNRNAAEKEKQITGTAPKTYLCDDGGPLSAHINGRRSRSWSDGGRGRGTGRRREDGDGQHLDGLGHDLADLRSRRHRHYLGLFRIEIKRAVPAIKQDRQQSNLVQTMSDKLCVCNVERLEIPTATHAVLITRKW